MTIILKKTESIDNLNQRLSKRKKRKRKDISKYFGKLKRGLDGLEYQTKMRDEWK